MKKILTLLIILAIIIGGLFLAKNIIAFFVRTS